MDEAARAARAARIAEIAGRAGKMTIDVPGSLTVHVDRCCPAPCPVAEPEPGSGPQARWRLCCGTCKAVLAEMSWPA